MARLLQSPSSCSRALSTEPSCRFTLCSEATAHHCRFHRASNNIKTRGLPLLLRCSYPVGFVGEEEKDVVDERKVEYLASEYGWRVRRLKEDDGDEIRRVALVQAEAFHIPVVLLDDLFFLFFQAEVLSGLLYKLRNSPPDRYACLVAESASNPSVSGPNAERGIVGVVDLTVQRDKPVLKHLDAAEEYLYVSGLAVSKSLRRMKIGSSLLRACDAVCRRWGFRWLVLKAYEEDVGARTLYSKAGYRVVAADPPWTSTWIGRKRRVLMIKEIY